MSTQNEQFIDWFLPEEDSIEAGIGDVQATTATSLREVKAERPRRKAFRLSRATGHLPIWMLLAVGAGGMIGTVAAGRFELIPVWSAFVLLCWLVRTALASSKHVTAPATMAVEALARDTGPSCVMVPPSTDDLTFEPLVRNKPPGEGEEPLSSILIQDGEESGYRNAWVIVTFLVTNRSDASFAFVCNRLKLRWCGQNMELEPIDMLNWKVEPYRAVKVSTIAQVWTDEIPELVHTTTGELKVCVDCLTTETPMEIGLRPRVWKTGLRPAFCDEGPIHLVAGPAVARTSSRVHAAV